MRVNELNKKIKISLLPSGTVPSAFSEHCFGRVGRPRREGRAEKANQKSQEASRAFLSPRLRGFTRARPKPCQPHSVKLQWPQPLHCRSLHPRGSASPHPPCPQYRPLCTLAHRALHTPRPLAAQAQHLVDGRVDHHPSDDLCLVGHLWLLLQGRRSC